MPRDGKDCELTYKGRPEDSAHWTLPQSGTAPAYNWWDGRNSALASQQHPSGPRLYCLGFSAAEAAACAGPDDLATLQLRAFTEQ